MKYIEITIEDRIATITLQRAEKRNALNGGMVAELTQTFKTLENDNTRVIIMKAEGSAFSAGADLEYLKKLRDNSFEENLEDSRQLKTLFELIYGHPKITIAQVEGAALAGGCGLATVCDFIYAVPEAQFGYTEVKIGFVPAIVMFFLLRRIGEAGSRRLLLTGDIISADKALQMNLITGIFKPDEIEGQIKDIAKRLALSVSPQSISHTKKMMAIIATIPWQQALDYAAQQNAHARATPDCKKGIDAFLKKEKIIWQD